MSVIDFPVADAAHRPEALPLLFLPLLSSSVRVLISFRYRDLSIFSFILSFFPSCRARSRDHRRGNFASFVSRCTRTYGCALREKYNIFPPLPIIIRGVRLISIRTYHLVIFTRSSESVEMIKLKCRFPLFSDDRHLAGIRHSSGFMRMQFGVRFTMIHYDGVAGLVLVRCRCNVVGMVGRVGDRRHGNWGGKRG